MERLSIKWSSVLTKLGIHYEQSLLCSKIPGEGHKTSESARETWAAKTILWLHDLFTKCFTLFTHVNMLKFKLSQAINLRVAVDRMESRIIFSVLDVGVVEVSRINLKATLVWASGSSYKVCLTTAQCRRVANFSFFNFVVTSLAVLALQRKPNNSNQIRKKVRGFTD